MFPDDTVKQADVVLMGYPLMADLSEEIRMNDLEIYEKASSIQFEIRYVYQINHYQGLLFVLLHVIQFQKFLVKEVHVFQLLGLFFLMCQTVILKFLSNNVE